MLKEYLTSIADSIRAKLGTSEKINAQSYADKISEVYDEGYAKGAEECGLNLSQLTDWQYFFYNGARESILNELKYSDTSNGENFNRAFYQSKITEFPNVDLTNATNIGSMFYGCTKMTKVSALNTSEKLKNADQLFRDCILLEEVPLFETCNVTSFGNMFFGCSKLVRVPHYNTSKVTGFNYTFRNCSALEEVPLFDMSNTSNLIYMFCDCTSLKSVPEFDTKKVNSFNYMFDGCTSLVTVPCLDTSAITKLSGSFDYVFRNCSALETVIFTGKFVVKKNLSIFSYSPNLTVESLMSLINAFDDNSTLSSTYTVTIGSTNLAKLTQEQIDIATAKNIILA